MGAFAKGEYQSCKAMSNFDAGGPFESGMTGTSMSIVPASPKVPFWLRYWPVFVLALLPLIPLWRAVFMGEAIGPYDQIRQMAPWNGPKPAQAWDVLQADGVLQFTVWRDLVFDAWGKGQAPFWNPYQLAGYPLLANSQSGALYPPHILMGLLHVPTATAMTLLAWFHLFWAGLGVFVFCRALGASKIGACIGGASFSLSSFMIAWTGLPSVIETVAWIPWVLALVVLIFERNPLLVRLRAEQPAPEPADVSKAVAQTLAESRHYSWLTLSLAVCLGMMILAGHLQFVAYGLMAMALLVIWMVATRRNPVKVSDVSRVSIGGPGGKDAQVNESQVKGILLLTNPVLGSTLRVVLAGVLGLCIAAPQLLAVLQYSQFSHRKNTPTADGYSHYVGDAIQPYELVKVIVPSLQGNPRQIASEQLPISTYYPAVLKPGANFAESAIGLGAFVVFLICCLPMLFKIREPVWGVMVVGLFGLLLALGSPLDQLLYFGVPGWSSTGSPGRAVCLFVLAACVGAGVAASRLSDVKPLLLAKSPKLASALAGFVGVCLLCFVFKNTYELRHGLNKEIVDGLQSQAEAAAGSSGAGISLLAIFGIVFGAWERSVRSKVVLLTVPILSCVAFFGMSLVQTGSPDLHVANSAGMERIAPVNASWDLFQAVHATLPPNLSALNRIHSLDGYDSLLHRDTVALLQDIDGKGPAPDANGNMMLIKPSADWQKLADAGVSEVWSAEPISALGEAPKQDNLYKYKLKGPGRASTPAGKAEIVKETTSGMELKATGPGKLVVRDRNIPGWLAKVDGQHTPIGGTTWMELDLPAGEHKVELNYVPPGFMTGVLLAFPAWLIVFLLVFRLCLIGRRPAKQF